MNILIDLRNAWNSTWIKFSRLFRIEWNTDKSSLGVDAKRSFKQMVETCSDVNIQSGVQIVQHDFFNEQSSLRTSSPPFLNLKIK